MLTTEEVAARILRTVREAVQDFDDGLADRVGPESRVLADLDLEAIQIVQLFSSIQEQFGARKIPFQELVFRGDDVADFSLRDLAAFVHSHLGGAAP